MLVLLFGLILACGPGARAQDDLAASGNGGTGTGSANGGAAAIGDLMSGENVGNAVLLGSTGGSAISGGAVANSTDGTVAVDGGTAIAGVDGGDENISFTYEPAPKHDGDNGGNNGGTNGGNDAFEICVGIGGPPANVCGGGTCTGEGQTLQCAPDFCEDFGFPVNCRLGFEGTFGGSECFVVNANRVDCFQSI